MSGERHGDYNQPPQIKSRLGAILRVTSGNFLEQFDFFLFGFYATAISQGLLPGRQRDRLADADLSPCSAPAS